MNSPARAAILLGLLFGLAGTTLIFLIGAGVGSALVAGLAELVGVPATSLALIALPVAGIGPDRVAATR